MASAFSIKGEHPDVILKRLGTDYIIPGLIAQLIAIPLFHDEPYSAGTLPAWILLALGTASVLVGCYRQATYKRYSTWVAHLGWLSLAGVLLLYALPRRRLDRGRRGFEVVRPRQVSTLWVVDPEVDPQRGGYRQFVRPHVLERAEEIAAQVRDE
jgi:hypothetical protein